MADENIAVIVEAEKDRIEAKAPTPMQEINAALKECGFGWFQIRLLLSSLFGFVCGIFVTNATPYILPNAECDLNMNLLHKGVLNAAPFAGMIASSIVAGFLTDTFGRLIFLIGGYAGIFVFTVISAFSQTYEMLIFSKFCEGLLFATAHSPCMTFTAEYCHNDVRDRVLLFQSSFQSISQIVLAALSWIILIQDWETSFFGGKIVLHTWNYYLLILSLFSLTASILFSLQPESPKFLVTQNRFDEARENLRKVYRINTGKPIETFSYANLWKDRINTLENPVVTSNVKKTLSSQLVNGLYNIKPMFRKPLLFNLIHFCVLNYIIMTLYNTVRLWFPQLSTIVEHYSKVVGNTELCEMLDAYTEDLRSNYVNVTVIENEVCIPARSGTETYINSLILGFISMLPFALSGILVNKIGKKVLIIIGSIINIIITLWLRWSSSKTEIVGLFAVDLAIAQTMLGLLQATTVECFPTSSRTLAVSIIMTCGRTASIVANVLFPILLNMGCVVPLYTLAGFMVYKDSTIEYLTPMEEVNAALKECNFGRFQIRLLSSAFFAMLAGTFITNTTPYILPNAECDLNMNLLHKGIINAVPFFGMLVSSVVAGFLTDTFGRKKFIVGGYGGIFFFTLISAFSQTYEMLIFSKFFEGMLFASAHSACTTLTAEYCHKEIRDRVMIIQSSYKSVGQIVLALITWGILIQDWRVTFFDEWIVLNTWNFYLLIISMFSFTACILYCFQPESPKYLVTQNRLDEAREALKTVYKTNSGKSGESFKYANLWMDQKKSNRTEIHPDTAMSVRLLEGLHKVKPMFRKPLLSILILFCCLNFLVMAMYNVIRLWFPQLSTIVEHYSGKDGNHELCVMLDTYTEDLRLKAGNVTGNIPEVCVPTRSGTETYVNSIILGFICLTPILLSGALVNKLGKKLLLLVCGVLTVAVTLWLRWSNSKAEVVGLFAADMAIGQTMMSLIQANTVEVFPTATRTSAIGILMTVGRIGSLVGNVMFPILLNMGCVVPFYTITGFMVVVTVLNIMVPSKKPVL